LFNIDIDGDDISDEVMLDCPHSAASADGCLLSVELSSGGKFMFDEGWFYMVRRHARFYLVVTTEGKAKRRSRSLYKVDRNGVSLLCGKL
jgi:hypothetical protein